MSKMITIDVRVFANFREVLGVKKFPLQIKPRTTIREFLALIEEKFENGKQFLEEVMDPDTHDHVKVYVKFMINGKILFPDKILDSTIDNEGDVVAIFPPIGGG